MPSYGTVSTLVRFSLFSFVQRGQTEKLFETAHHQASKGAKRHEGVYDGVRL